MRAICLILLFACSSVGDKKTLRDEVIFQGGRFKQDVWKESLNFKRVSWFSRSTLEFDFYLAEVSTDSKFNQWFSGGERKYISECGKIYISLSTSNRSRVLSDPMYVSQMKKNNLSEIITPNFLDHLRLHPDYVRWNLTMYRPRLFCGGKNIDIVTIDFPSFETVKIKL